MPAQSRIVKAVASQAATAPGVLEFFGEVANVRVSQHEMVEEIDLNARVNNR